MEEKNRLRVNVTAVMTVDHFLSFLRLGSKTQAKEIERQRLAYMYNALDSYAFENQLTDNCLSEINPGDFLDWILDGYKGSTWDLVAECGTRAQVRKLARSCLNVYGVDTAQMLDDWERSARALCSALIQIQHGNTAVLYI